jgi:hypothetical protein
MIAGTITHFGETGLGYEHGTHGYIPLHLISLDDFGETFESEAEVFTFLTAITKQSKRWFLDWRLSKQQLQEHPIWEQMGHFVALTARRIRER